MSGRPIQQSELKHLYRQGVWIFGDWYSAVAAIGLDPEKLGLHTFWDKDRVIREIQNLKRKRLQLYPVYIMKSHRELFSAGYRQYSSWAKALRAAGLRHLGRRSGLGALCRLREAVESREAISKELRAELDYYFGSVAKAKGALRTDKHLLTRWSRQKVISMTTR